MDNVIEVNSLVKNFGQNTAVNDISFSVGKGESFAFLGPNGAGKSTTINILCTLMKATSGTVNVLGHMAGKDDEQIRRHIGIVFQGNCLDNLLTVEQNLILRAHLYESDKKKILENLEKLDSILGIGELLKRPFGKLSGGQKRRCEIARALMNSPEILFLDEPTTGLDPQTRAHVWKCIELLRAEHEITIFFTTHYMEEVNNAARIAIMDRGRIVVTGTRLELINDYTSNVLKIASTDANGIRSTLNKMNLVFQEKPDLFDLKIPNSLKALEILKATEKYVNSFEVIHGTMDDVFLNITGKSLRED
ncbi:MAG: ATP-binding cassette domain-containing protein [Bacillota bacterium]|nr:ATP-binding cassette domain-containing protein [Bacillota bacterium]